MEYVKLGYGREGVSFLLALGALCAAISSFAVVRGFSFTGFFSYRSLKMNSETAYSLDDKKNSIGPETYKLIRKIEQMGLNPLVVGKSQRTFFSVEGRVVALSGDNIKVYEYPNNMGASAEVSNFQESAKTRMGSWKKTVHLYAKGNIIVFYMGERKKIIDPLMQIFGKAVAV